QANWSIAIGSADGLRLEQINPAFARMHGYSVAELEGASILDVFAPAVRASVADHIELAHRLGRYRFESQHLHRDGHTFPVSIDITTVKDADGSVLYRIVSVQDISEQKKADAELDQIQAELVVREKFLRSLYENAPVATAICALDGRYISVNRAMCDMLGYSEQELLSMTFVDVSHPEDAARNVTLREGLLTKERLSFAMEKRYIHKCGDVLWGYAAVSLVTDANGQPLFTIGQMININNEKAMQQQLTAVREQRDTLIREVHHRIKNNLQSVTGLLYRQKLANPSLGGMLNNAIQQVETIAIVHGLQSAGQRGHIQLCQILAEIVAAANTLNADATPIALSNELRQPLLITDDETVPLALVLNELITNAIKYCDRMREEGVAITMLRPAPDTAVVEIVNPTHTFPRSFNFESGTGIGMGLKLVRSLLPRTGVRIQYTTADDAVVTQVWLTAPVVLITDNNFARLSESDTP
ncbi:MAG TPA: PAS domain S-box protein, partial [Spongiibacteraceae bacterium]|nr:PAS domain S-box protein [Spongiibacteraceae bacterium]